MLRRTLGALVVALVVGGIVLAEETRGTISKVEDGSITIRTFTFTKDKDKGFKSEDKTFKVSKDVKVVRTGGKDKEDVKLTFEAPKGIKVEPNPLTVKASDKEEASVKVTVDKEAALGEHEIKVTGTPAKGKETSVSFKVEVVKP